MATTLTEYQTRLATLNSAIEKAEANQQYSTGSLSLTRGPLAAMYAERKRIEDKIEMLEAASSSAGVSYGRMRRFR